MGESCSVKCVFCNKDLKLVGKYKIETYVNHIPGFRKTVEIKTSLNYECDQCKIIRFIYE